jgi:hypothetical protein
MKRFTIPCDFGGVKAPFHIYVGKPLPGSHPLRFQAAWLRELRGGTFPPEVMESFQKLMDIAEENQVSFEELCVYALGTAEAGKTEAATSEPEDAAGPGPQG